MTDTDSLLLAIRTRNLVDDISTMKKFFDCSNYPPTHRLWDPTTKNKLFMLKDECAGSVLCEFIGLRSKMYSYKVTDEGEDKENHVAKGRVFFLPVSLSAMQTNLCLVFLN